MGNSDSTIKAFPPTGPTEPLFMIENQYYVDGASGIAADPAGNIFVSSETKNCIYQIVAGQLFASVFAGHPGGYAGNVDGPRLQAQFHSPMGLLILPDASVVVSDHNNRAVRRITPDGTVETLSTNLKLGPQDIIQDTTDGTFLVSVQHGLVRVSPLSKLDGPVDSNNRLVTGLWGASGYADGFSSDSRFRNPHGLALLPSNHILIADSGNNTIRKYARGNGNIATVAGCGLTDQNLGADACSAHLHAPSAIAADTKGRVALLDSQRSQIRIYDSNTAYVSGPVYNFGAYTGKLEIRACCIDAMGRVWFTSPGQNKVVCLKLLGATPAPGQIVSLLPADLNVAKHHEANATQNIAPTLGPAGLKLLAQDPLRAIPMTKPVVTPAKMPGPDGYGSFNFKSGAIDDGNVSFSMTSGAKKVDGYRSFDSISSSSSSSGTDASMIDTSGILSAAGSEKPTEELPTQQSPALGLPGYGSFMHVNDGGYASMAPIHQTNKPPSIFEGYGAMPRLAAATSGPTFVTDYEPMLPLPGTPKLANSAPPAIKVPNYGGFPKATQPPPAHNFGLSPAQPKVAAPASATQYGAIPQPQSQPNIPVPSIAPSYGTLTQPQTKATPGYLPLDSIPASGTGLDAPKASQNTSKPPGHLPDPSSGVGYSALIAKAQSAPIPQSATQDAEVPPAQFKDGLHLASSSLGMLSLSGTMLGGMKDAGKPSDKKKK